jgi:hypothetical protein
MSVVTSILPKLLVFLVSVALGAAVASVAVTAMKDRSPVSDVGTTPEYVLAGSDTPAGPGPVVAFNEEPAPSGSPAPVPTLSPDDLSAAAAELLGGGPQDVGPPAFNDPTGFPRIRPITQFDGGPFQGANCTLASGAMLARLAFGIVTTGSILRTLQDDQDGGTGLNDLNTALWRGYGVTAHTGLLRPQTLKDLLANGYGAVIQGIYGEIPVQIRLQKNFTGGHAIYLDGYYPGNPARGIPEAYYVIDPIGRPHSGYQGDWWPASIVDTFAEAWGGGRIAAMWAFPPGGVPPVVVGPDVLPIPPDQPSGPAHTPSPSESLAPSEAPSGSPSASLNPSGSPTVTLGDPGDTTVDLPSADPNVGGGKNGGIIKFPVFDICLINPSLPACPKGLPALFPPGVSPPILQLGLGPTVKITFIDSDRANQVMVGFTVDPPTSPADVKFWAQGVSPAAVEHASAMGTLNLLGQTMIVARLDTKAATTYNVQAVAGSGFQTGVSDIATFTTGGGVEAFDVSVSSVASPVFKIGTGLSPYTKQAADAFVHPMVRLDKLSGVSCQLEASFGGTGYCLDQQDLDPQFNVCTSAQVTYELAGIDADSVAVRAFPVDAGKLPGGGLTLDGVIEASGPPGSGTVKVGCLASGMQYTITIDAVGDDRGVLASKVVDIP